MPAPAAMKWDMWTVSVRHFCGCQSKTGYRLQRKRNSSLCIAFDSKSALLWGVFLLTCLSRYRNITTKEIVWDRSMRLDKLK